MELPILEPKCQQWINGVELLDDALRNKRFLPTGCEGLDTLLGGGLREGQLTELVGPFSSGKTQICLYVASHVAVRHCGSLVFLDTSNSFSPNRIASIINQICRPVGIEDQERIKMIMSSIHCQSVFDIFSLQDVLLELDSTLRTQTVRNDTKICMLIIDSVSSLIAPILGSKDSQGRSLMVSAGYLMKKLAHEWNISVLIRQIPSFCCYRTKFATQQKINCSTNALPAFPALACQAVVSHWTSKLINLLTVL